MKKLLIILIACMASLAGYAEKAPKCHKPIAKHVILIGLDGFAGNTLDSADMPVTKALMAQGCVTRQKRCAAPSCSAPNWATTFMGSNPDLHGYSWWGAKHPEKLPSRVILKNNIYPTICQIYRNADPKAEIGVTYDWPVIKFLVDTLSCNYFAHAANNETNHAELSLITAEYIKANKPNLLITVFGEPDHTGHAVGWRTPEYYDKLTEYDAYVSNIIEATKEAGIYDDTVFIITSDHGGVGKGHGAFSADEMDTPMIIAGKGIRQGVELETSICNMDVSPTIARILGIEEFIPQPWTGRPILDAFKR